MPTFFICFRITNQNTNIIIDNQNIMTAKKYSDDSDDSDDRYVTCLPISIIPIGNPHNQYNGKLKNIMIPDMLI